MKMRVFDKKIITLNDGKRDIRVLVYLKEVYVKNNFIKTKAICRIVKDKTKR